MRQEQGGRHQYGSGGPADLLFFPLPAYSHLFF